MLIAQTGQVEHTIQWARDLFEGYYAQSASDVNTYLSQPDFLQNLERQPGVRKPTLGGLAELVVPQAQMEMHTRAG